MVDFLKKSGLAQLVAVLLVAVALWLHALVSPPDMESSAHAGPLYLWLCYWLAPLPRLAVALGLLLTVAEAAWLNVLLVENKLMSNNTFLPALCYILLSGFGYESKTLTEMLFVNLAVIYGAAQFMTGTQPILSRVKMCNAVTAISVASLFYVPAIFLLIPFMVQFFVFRMYQWKDLVAMLLGLMAPYVMLLIVAYMSYNMSDVWSLTGRRMSLAGFHVAECGALKTVYYVVFLSLALLCLFQCLSHNSEQTSVNRRNAGAYLLPLTASVAFVVYEGLWPVRTILIAVPSAYAAAVVLCNVRRRKWMADAALCLALVIEIVIESV